jgi:serine protease Do
MRTGRILLIVLAMPCVASAVGLADELVQITRPLMIARLLPAVVNIISYVGTAEPPSGNAVTAATPAGGRPKTLDGSGFIFDPAGYIATNYHVVEGAYRIVVMFSDGKTADAKIFGSVRVGDIAVLRVDVGTPLTAAKWGDSDQLQLGDPVFAVGNPLGLGLSVSAGIVSALNRNIVETPYDHFIQTDAAINHGNSGGPLFNMQGEVVGMDTAIVSPTTGSSGLGFAIPSNGVRFVVDRIEKYGWMRPAWLGVKVEQITPELAEAIGMANSQGEIIAKVFDGSPASAAGFQVGDVIIQFGDHMPPNEPALLRDIVHAPIGEEVKVVLWRNGQTEEHTIKVAEWPRKLWDTLNAPEVTAPVVERISADLGLSLGPLTKDARARYQLGANPEGVLITGVAANTDAAHRGLAAGDVILRVQQDTIASSADMRAALDKARAQQRKFAAMLVLQPTSTTATPAPRWLAVRIASD